MSEPEIHIDVEEEEWDEGDWDDENQESLYINYLFEGVETLPELAAAFRALAGDLDARAQAGWQMDDSVDGGWVHLRRPPTTW